MPTLTKQSEYRRLGWRHTEFANEYAERSHEFEGELSDHYSSVAEAHHGLASALFKAGGEPELEEREP